MGRSDRISRERSATGTTRSHRHQRGYWSRTTASSGPSGLHDRGLIGCDFGCPSSAHLEIGGTSLALSGDFVTAGRNNDAVSFDLATVFDRESQGREPKAQAAQTLTLNAREGRNRALLMIVLPPHPMDNPPLKFESWILLKSAPLATK